MTCTIDAGGSTARDQYAMFRRWPRIGRDMDVTRVVCWVVPPGLDAQGRLARAQLEDGGQSGRSAIPEGVRTLQAVRLCVSRLRQVRLVNQPTGVRICLNISVHRPTLSRFSFGHIACKERTADCVIRTKMSTYILATHCVR